MKEDNNKFSISVIVPARNEEAYIGETLRALMAQKYPREAYEIIVVDNGSTDGTSAITAAFGGIKLVHEERRGVQFARERGRREAHGVILAFLDADTRPSPDWLLQGEGLCSKKGVAAVSGPCNFYDIGPVSRFFAHFFFDYSAWHFIFYSVFKKCGVIAGGNFFVRTTALQAIGGFDCSIDFYGDDTDTGMRLMREGKLLYRRAIRVDTSARRFRQLGFFKTLRLYAVNFFWIFIFGRPYTKTQ